MSKFLKYYSKLSMPAKASMWFVVCNLIQKGIAFITTPIFTRVMETEAYGTIVIYNSWTEIITIFATFQLATGVFNKAMIKYENDRDGYTSSTLFLASMLTLTTFVLYLVFHNTFNFLFNLPTLLAIMIFIEIFFSSAMSLWSIRNRFEYRYKSVILLTLIVAVIGPLSSLIFINILPLRQQAFAKIFGMLIVKVIVYGTVFLMILYKGRKIVVFEYWKYSLLYNLPLIPHYLSQQVLTQSDRIMIDRICGTGDAAVYGVAYQLSMTLFIFTLAIHNSFTPWTYEMLKDKKYVEINKYAVLIELGVGVVCFFFSLFAPELIYILGGDRYVKAVWIVAPVSMSILFQTIYTFFGNIEFYFEKTKFVMIASIGVAFCNILLNIIFIPKFGFIAAGYTTLACYILYSIVHYIFMKSMCIKEGMPKIFNECLVWGISIVCIILSFIANFLYKYKDLRYAFIIVLFIATIFIVCIGKKYVKKILRK